MLNYRTKQERKAYKIAWARRIRASVFRALVKAFGKRCEKCGRKSGLEIHHRNGRDYILAALSQDQRAARLRRELKQGELGLLCRSCNAREW